MGICRLFLLNRKTWWNLMKMFKYNRFIRLFHLLVLYLQPNKNEVIKNENHSP